jgi:hypothetical protein
MTAPRRDNGLTTAGGAHEPAASAGAVAVPKRRVGVFVGILVGVVVLSGVGIFRS